MLPLPKPTYLGFDPLLSPIEQLSTSLQSGISKLAAKKEIDNAANISNAPSQPLLMRSKKSKLLVATAPIPSEPTGSYKEVVNITKDKVFETITIPQVLRARTVSTFADDIKNNTKPFTRARRVTPADQTYAPETEVGNPLGGDSSLVLAGSHTIIESNNDKKGKKRGIDNVLVSNDYHGILQEIANKRKSMLCSPSYDYTLGITPVTQEEYVAFSTCSGSVISSLDDSDGSGEYYGYSGDEADDYSEEHKFDRLMLKEIDREGIKACGNMGSIGVFGR